MPDDRAIIVETASGEALTFTHLEGFDEVSRCFAFTVGLTGPALDVAPEALVGRPVALEVESAEPRRWIHGLATEFRLIKVEERVASYAVTLRPWLWLLSLTHDCRIFQNLSAVEIVEEVFSKYPQAKVEKRLQKSYPQREYCVQYDESDLDFVQRLMEAEGMFYFFEYAEDGHTLVLVDAMAKLRPAPGYETVPFHIEGAPARRDRDFVSDWTLAASLRPTAYVHTDYNFETPGLSLLTQSAAEPTAKLFAGEHYGEPGAHPDLARGDGLALIRREELQAANLRVRAAGTARGLASGAIFTLSGHPRDSQNAEHLALRVEYRITDPEHRAGAPGGGETYWVEMIAAPASLPFRPERRTPRPVMRGPQTATVVGPAGQEIFTDRHARVKVQFHWDRLGKRDENSSCFVRVSQSWAGAGWGFIQIPRIGQEVIVDFIEGDPDRPIITGRVYNAAETPPYGLPGNATQSGWKSNSSPGGGGWNELRFEDKAGAEQVYFQAQKDHQLLVKNDRAKLVQHDQSDRIDNNARHSVGVNLDEDVGNDKTTKIGVDRRVDIGSNDTEAVGANRSLTVGVDETISIGSNSTETIGANHAQTVALIQTVTVGAARIDTVGAAETRTVGAAQVNTIGAFRQVSVGAAQSHDIGASDSWTIAAGQSVEVGAAQSFQVGAARSATIGADDSATVSGARTLTIAKGSLVDIGEGGTIKVGKDLMIEAGDSITLKCGSATVVMRKDGTISIDGKDITVNGSGKINVKASGDITMKGAKINQN